MGHFPYYSLRSYEKMKVTRKYILYSALFVITIMTPFIVQFILIRPDEPKYEPDPNKNMTFEYVIKDNICPTHYIEKINAYVSDCSNRNLTEIPGYVQFSNFECRKENVKCVLNLNNNHITTFKFDEKLRSVTHLYLANNSLTEVWWLPLLTRELDLSNNSLGIIDASASEDNFGLEKLEKLAAQNNPWICNCNLSSIFGRTGISQQKLVNVVDLLCDDGRTWNARCGLDWFRFLLLTFGLVMGTTFTILLTARTRFTDEEPINYQVHFKNISEELEVI